MKTVNRQVGKYISYKLKLNNITYKDIAKSASLSYSIIALTLNGRKGSQRAKKAIATALGYADFKILEYEAIKAVNNELNKNNGDRNK
ncbi:hypothetical protein WESB_0311 [Brachyspira pilosicoli WesB]|uniref:HTH cro/C1-type domain-containing protein n=1 Tax=Brachyspira pilosicoli WesB TaxID=1161918 RepID=K0JGA7_BRAPL|nr:hypothetical protein [Brachyspira pilosicoli]CCG55782.1 hypothetical protein WESB_0311 [Brachyspira pilosicoli WesB]